MKRLYFFNKQFNYKDVITINDFNPIIDIVSTQNFKITTSLTPIVENGDICILKENNYIKFIGNILNVEDTDNNLKTITITYIDELFNINGEIENLSGNIITWITNTLTTNFISISDNLQKINLSIVNNCAIAYTGIYTFDNVNIKNCLRNIFDYSGIYIDYDIEFASNGDIENLICNIRSNSEEDTIKLKYNMPIIDSIKRIVTNSQNVNKLVLLPDDTVTGGSRYEFYLLKDGTISTDAENENRFENVKQEIQYYASDYTPESLLNSAKEVLGGQQFAHSIGFYILKENNFNIIPYKKILFYDKDNIIYNSIITKIQYGTKFDYVELGVVRLKLTDKLQKNDSKTLSSSVSSTGSDYVLPQATGTTLGGIIAETKTTETNEIKIDTATGKLYAPTETINMDNVEDGETYVKTENNLTDTLKSNYDTAYTNTHTHSNKALLDTYTQTEVDLAEAVSKKHTHSNKTILDNTTASYTTDEQTKLTGIQDGAEVNIIEEIQKNGTSITPIDRVINLIIPTQASDVDALPDSTLYGASIDLTYTASTGIIGLTLKDQNGNTLNSDSIDLPLEMLIESGSVKTCTTADVPVVGYVVGDKYIDLVLANSTHIYILVSDLIDQVEITETGTGNAVTDISISGNVITEIKGKTFVETSRTINGFDLSANRTLTQDNIGNGATYVQTENNLTDTLKSNYDTAYTNTHTHANKTALDNVSGINTGDQTSADFTLSGLSEKNFSSLANKPTTISGYEITDAYTETEINSLLTRKSVQPYIQRAYSGGNGIRLVATYNYSTSVGDTRPIFYMVAKQGHGNGISYLYWGEYIFGVSTTGTVTAKSILKISDGTYGKLYYRHDTTNKILYLYIYTGQYSSAYFSDLIQINAGDYSSYFTLVSAGSVTTDTVTEGVNVLYPASKGTMALQSELPTITLNGTVTTTPTFYAPTSQLSTNETKNYLVGASSTTSISTEHTNESCYMQSGVLYSNSLATLNTSNISTSFNYTDTNMYSTKYIEDNFAQLLFTTTFYANKTGTTTANLTNSIPTLNSSNYLTATTTNTVFNWTTPSYVFSNTLTSKLTLKSSSEIYLSLPFAINRNETVNFGYRIKINGTAISSNQNYGAIAYTGNASYLTVNRIYLQCTTDLLTQLTEYNSGDIITIEVFTQQATSTSMTMRIYCGATINDTNYYAYNELYLYKSQLSNATPTQTGLVYGYVDTINYNTGLGYNVLNSNTDGYYDVAIGTGALSSNTTGFLDIAIGTDALSSNTTGFFNIAIGYNAGSNTDSLGFNQTSKESIYIGNYTQSLADGDINEIVIGHGTAGNGSNTVTIGNDLITANYFKGELYLSGYQVDKIKAKSIVNRAGYIKYASGLIIQWGYVAVGGSGANNSYQINYNTAFSSSTSHATVTTYEGSTSTSNFYGFLTSGQTTSTYFKAKVYGGNNFNWFAIGY